jgi:hypothetical protein
MRHSQFRPAAATLRPLIALTLIAFAALLFAQPASASRTQVSLFQEDARLLSPDPAIRADALDRIKALGADDVKVAVLWRLLSPNYESSSRPAGNPADPSYYNWGVLPAVISEIRARGMNPWLMITGVGPNWASSKNATKSMEGGYKPSPELFGDFSVAAFNAFPDVEFVQIGNEPNFQLWLWPQIVANKVSAAAVHYRKMYFSAENKIIAQGLGSRKLLFGALAPRAKKPVKGERATQPVRFLRDFFCLDDKLKPLKGRAAKLRECPSKFPAVRASGFAYHPYTGKNGPRERPSGIDDAPVAYMSRIYKVLDRAYATKRLKTRKIPVWNDEFAFESNPPDGQRTKLALVPEYLNESEFLSWKDARMRSYAQYTLFDEPHGNLLPGVSIPVMSGFQSGLLFFDGSKKGDLLAAYRTPLVVTKTRSSKRVSVWFGVRNFSALPGLPAAVQFRAKKTSPWRVVKTVAGAGNRRYTQTTVNVNGALTGQFRVVIGEQSSRVAVAGKPLSASKK